MAGNYEKSVYNQLMEVMVRLDTDEKESKQEITLLKEEVSALKIEKQHLREENKLLRDDNSRLKSIINNDSSNTSLAPSTIKSKKLAIHQRKRMSPNMLWLLMSPLILPKLGYMQMQMVDSLFHPNTIMMLSMTSNSFRDAHK